jgi:hypothetical protein
VEGESGGRGYTYVVDDFVERVEAGEEAGFVWVSHFVGDAGGAVGGAYDAVVCGVEEEFYGLKGGKISIRVKGE